MECLLLKFLLLGHQLSRVVKFSYHGGRKFFTTVSDTHTYMVFFMHIYGIKTNIF